MAPRESSSPEAIPAILRYSIAVLSVAIATGAALVLTRFSATLTPFLFAVGATVWYAGVGPGILAIVLSVLSLDFFFVTPFYSFSFRHADLVYLVYLHSGSHWSSAGSPPRADGQRKNFETPATRSTPKCWNGPPSCEKARAS